MVEYRKSILNKIKSVLLYLVKFSDDESMLFKKCPNNCKMGGLNQRLIIIITYDKSPFSTNNSYQKYRLLIVKKFYDRKKKEGEYDIRFFITIVKTKFLIFTI